MDGPFALGTCPEALATGGSVASYAITNELCSIEGPGGAVEGGEGGLAGEAESLIAKDRAIEREIAALCSETNSFAGPAKVLMADGTSKPISQIKVGDKITNALPGADPGTHDQTHTVTAIHITHSDHDYTEITIAAASSPHTITGTAHHLYWDTTTRAWTPADHLHAGDKIQSSNGRNVTIATLYTHATMITYNLTIDGLHTYYVEAGTTPVLVHNAGGCGDPVRIFAGQQAAGGS